MGRHLSVQINGARRARLKSSHALRKRGFGYAGKNGNIGNILLAIPHCAVWRHE
jgi:hypothetical protein